MRYTLQNKYQSSLRPGITLLTFRADGVATTVEMPDADAVDYVLGQTYTLTIAAAD